MREITEIITHCSATGPEADIGFKEINKWHKEEGWDGCGYHYIIRKSGMVEIGREITREGAHVLGHNKNSIGICLIGGVDDAGKPVDSYEMAQWIVWLDLVKTLHRQFPEALMLGHNDFTNLKTCPNFNVPETWELLKDKIIELPRAES